MFEKKSSVARNLNKFLKDPLWYLLVVLKVKKIKNKNLKGDYNSFRPLKKLTVIQQKNSH
jgi:hypothetical protein